MAALTRVRHSEAENPFKCSGESVTDEAALRQAMELLFFAYRDFTAEADTILARYGFGRAHHRVIYFVGRHPGASVSELLRILKITKQSLGRVLGQLMREGFIVQRADDDDRRRRRLFLTPEAEALERQLCERQMVLLRAVFGEVGSSAATGFRIVLYSIINRNDRERFEL